MWWGEFFCGMSPHRFGFGKNPLTSPTPPQGGSDFLSRWLAKSLKGGVIVGRSARGGRGVCLSEASGRTHSQTYMSDPYKTLARTQEKGPPALSIRSALREGGSPFFHLAMRIRVSYKKSRGCPLFPFPARGLKLTARSGTVCLSRGKQPTGNPLFLFSLLFSPGP